jgi:DNA replication protein DnaC
MTNASTNVPAPRVDCADCRGEGVLVFKGTEHAQSKVCGCVPTCSRCEGLGRVTATVDGVLTLGRCRCQLLVDRCAIFNRAQIPGRYASTTLVSFAAGANRISDMEKSRALAEVFAWMGTYEPKSESRGLILHGPVGRGKTHLLVGLLRHLIFHHGVPARFIEFSRLLSMLKEGYSAGRSDSGVLGELARVPVLAIDELGKGRLTEWELAVIDEVISRRYNGLGCTLATTNYAPGGPSGNGPANLARDENKVQTLGDRVDGRVYSRLREMCDFAEVGGVDYREVGL